ncbi:polyketide synthase [Apiospora rasikravindrae]|uniref:Polyketide synthase n=1 Tax=Apiospora rasikravindrae TaxID=990691 RepID=A0ABR1U7J4_9PEZI
MKDISETFPPTKGCIKPSMEVVFEDLEFPNWSAALEAKVTGSWSLHELLPTALDFFVMMSSIAGVAGRVSLAGYNAGNVYGDNLAHFRTLQGEHGVSINLGAVADQEYLVTHSDRRTWIKQAAQVELVTVACLW